MRPVRYFYPIQLSNCRVDPALCGGGGVEKEEACRVKTAAGNARRKIFLVIDFLRFSCIILSLTIKKNKKSRRPYKQVGCETFFFVVKYGNFISFYSFFELFSSDFW